MACFKMIKGSVWRSVASLLGSKHAPLLPPRELRIKQSLNTSETKATPTNAHTLMNSTRNAIIRHEV